MRTVKSALPPTLEEDKRSKKREMQRGQNQEDLCILRSSHCEIGLRTLNNICFLLLGESFRSASRVKNTFYVESVQLRAFLLFSSGNLRVENQGVRMKPAYQPQPLCLPIRRISVERGSWREKLN